MIKLAFIIDSIHLGGPGNVLRTMLRGLDMNKFDITLITLFKKRNDKEVINELKSLGVNIVMFNFENKVDFVLYGNKKLKKIILKNRFDIIHSHGLCPDILNARTRNTKNISTIHCNIFEDYPNTYGKFKGCIMIKLHLMYLKKMCRQICVSETVRNSLKKHLKNTKVIRNGIETVTHKELITKSDLSIPENAIVYIYIGRLTEGKNILSLLTNFNKYHLPNEYLIVFGRGTEEENCRKIEDGNIKIMGFSHKAIAHLQIADYYVSASKSEGFAISIVEALDNGLGLFVSDIPSHREVFEMADNLYLGETFNNTDFEKKLLKLRLCRKQIVPEEIIEFKRKKLSAKKMIADYVEIYTNISKEKLNC